MPSVPPCTEADFLDILIVDDEPLIHSLVSEVLSMWGHRPRSAESPDAALHELERQPCDLVITDIRMPRMDGLELAGMIRRLYPRTRIVVMTGHLLDLTGVDLDRLQISAFLSKPFTNAELRRAVDKCAMKVAPGLQADPWLSCHRLDSGGKAR